MTVSHPMTPLSSRFSLRRPPVLGGALALGLLALLSACAPSTRVTLLPQADGKPSAVDVSTGQGAQAITQPYQVAVVGRGGALSLDSTTPEQVQKAYPALLALQPPPAERFVLEFEPGTSQLTVVTRAQARAGGDIVVTGHTDRQGSVEANDRLSLERARAVRALLIAQGLQPERIEAVGRGEREPLVPTEDEVVEPRNRRAEVLVR
jgi:OmpA-OmpF porin, OOP family